MKYLNPAVRVIVAFIATILVMVGFSGVAQASPLLAPPPASQSLSEAPELDGTIHSTTPKEVKQDIHAAGRDEVKYGTGVNVGTQSEIGTMNVFKPAVSNGKVVTYAPATDSLSPWDAPSAQLDKGSLSDIDIAHINTLLDSGATVIIVNAYGDENPQYAGVLNGVRIANGVQAYKNGLSDIPVAEVACYGFSGGGIDCARVAEYRHSNSLFDTIIVDSGPTDLSGFLASSTDNSSLFRHLVADNNGDISDVKRGLGWAAGGGLEQSLSAEQRAVLYENLRPSAIVGAKLLATASNCIPVPKLVVGVMTLSGVVVPLSLDAAFKPGALDKPEVKQLLADINPDVPMQKYDGRMVLRYNESDSFVQPSLHAYRLAERYRAQGTNTVVITNHGQVAPGHAMMTTEQLLALVNGNYGSGDLDTYNSEPGLTDKVLNYVIVGAMWGISQYSGWLNEQAPPVLNELDRMVLDADKAIDQVITAPAVATQVVETVVDQGQQLLETVTTPQSEAPARNSDTIIETGRNWLPAQDAGSVENFVNSTPMVKQVLDSAPVTLPTLPPPGGRINFGGFEVPVPQSPFIR